jgi:hypothetical protein
METVTSFILILVEFLTALSENFGIKRLPIEIVSEQKYRWNMITMLLSGRASSLRRTF